jgi:hypothetical protein
MDKYKIGDDVIVKKLHLTFPISRGLGSRYYWVRGRVHEIHKDTNEMSVCVWHLDDHIPSLDRISQDSEYVKLLVI